MNTYYSSNNMTHKNDQDYNNRSHIKTSADMFGDHVISACSLEGNNSMVKDDNHEVIKTDMFNRSVTSNNNRFIGSSIVVAPLNYNEDGSDDEGSDIWISPFSYNGANQEMADPVIKKGLSKVDHNMAEEPEVVLSNDEHNKHGSDHNVENKLIVLNDTSKDDAKTCLGLSVNDVQYNKEQVNSEFASEYKSSIKNNSNNASLSEEHVAESSIEKNDNSKLVVSEVIQGNAQNKYAIKIEYAYPSDDHDDCNDDDDGIDYGMNFSSNETKLPPQVEINWSEDYGHLVLASRFQEDDAVIELGRKDDSVIYYYKFNEETKQYTTKPANSQWLDEQVGLEYRIMTNDEVEKSSNENRCFAAEQQKTQKEGDKFSKEIAMLSGANRKCGRVKITKQEINSKRGVAMTCGDRSEMQDTHLIKNSIHDYLIFGVFDGHGGKSVSDHLSMRFGVEVNSKLQDWNSFAAKYTSIDGNECIEMSEKARNVNALIMAHVNLDKESEASNVGSTAVTAVMIKEDLYVSNLGDSRAILIAPDGTVSQLTEDAKVMSVVNGKHQRNRHTNDVMERGGYIQILEDPDAEYVSSDQIRVNRSLLTPKAFGDKKLGLPSNMDKSLRNDGYTVAISARPDVVVVEKPEHGWDGYKILLCCDGLVDVASTNQVGAYVHDKVTEGCNYADIANDLVYLALKSDSLDNVTVLLSDVDQLLNIKK